MKSYTDIPQSKTLAEILPIESADLWWNESKNYPEFIKTYHEYLSVSIPPIPCWSLAALLNVLPKIYYPVKDHKTDLILGKPKDKWCVLYWDSTGMQDGEEALGDNPVDACVNMIVKLNEKNMI